MWWPVPALILLCFIAAWANHFTNGLHWDDIPVIGNNHAVQILGSPLKYFRSPRTFSSLPEQAQYRPLLTYAFALDYALTKKASPVIFQTDTFVWFVLCVIALYVLFRVIPGGKPLSAIVAAGLFAVHPATVDTVNYLMQRGTVMGAFGVAAGLAFWIVWPRMLPDRLWVDNRRNPENWREDLVKKRMDRLNGLYHRFIHLPVGWYLVPVVLGMMADPAAAVFAPLLAVYIALFEPGRIARRVTAAFVVCGGYFVFATAIAWRFDAASRIGWLPYLATQPWVVMRSVARFVFPVNYSPDPGLAPFRASDWPLALAGAAGLAALIYAATVASRRTQWKPVSFGLWWFLIAFLPAALLPSSMVEANWRMFLPLAGLALAVTRAAWIVFEGLAENPERRMAAIIGACALGVVIFAACVGVTHRRNTVWSSDDTFWEDVVQKNPENARGDYYYAEAMIADRDFDRALVYLGKAAENARGNGAVETDVALAFDHLGKDAEAEKAFRLATEAKPPYGRAWSRYSRWLMIRQQSDAALAAAKTAIQLEPTDVIARQTLMDVYASRFDWGNVSKVAKETLNIDPDDTEARQSETLGTSSVEQVAATETHAKIAPTVDEYLKLSVLYFNSARFQDCIGAAHSALKLNPELGEAWANIAAADHKLGKDDDAIDALRQVIRLRPDLTFAQGDLEYLINQKANAHK